jgi:hypothetical protein
MYHSCAAEFDVNIALFVRQKVARFICVHVSSAARLWCHVVLVLPLHTQNEALLIPCAQQRSLSRRNLIAFVLCLAYRSQLCQLYLVVIIIDMMYLLEKK